MRLDTFKNAFLVNLSLSVINIMSSVFIARFYGPVIRGDFSSILAFLNMLVALYIFGTPVFLANYYSRYGKTKKFFNIFLKISLVTTILSISTFSIFYKLFVEFQINPIDYFILIFYVYLSSFSVIVLNVNLGQGNWRSYNLGRLTFAFSNFLGIILMFLVKGPSIENLLYSITYSNIFTVIVQVLLSRFLFNNSVHYKISVIKTYKLARNYGLNDVVNIANGQADFLIFAFLLSSLNVGIWVVSRTYASLLSPINLAISNMIFSEYSSTGNNSDLDFSKVFRLTIITNLFLISILFPAAFIIVPLVFGDLYYNSIFLIPFSLLGSFLSSLSEIIEEKFRGISNAVPVSKIRVVPLLVFAVLVVLLYKDVNITSVASFYLISQLSRALYATILYTKSVNTSLKEFVIFRFSDFNRIIEIIKNVKFF